MDIYKQRSRWKFFLAMLGVVILSITLYYSNYLAQQLKENEKKNIYIYTEALKELADVSALDKDVFLNDTIVKSFSLPVIFEDEQGILQGNNWGESKDNDRDFLEKQKNAFLKSGKTPIEGIGYFNRIYCFNSHLLGYIRYYPLIQILLAGLFVFLGYMTFSSSKNAEQNRVWAGMAKETAHQLGTPISAIMGWIEYLRSTNDDEDHQEIMDELTKDVNRLNLVADRFSKIGSAPDLKKNNINMEVEDVIQYMQRRAPRKVEFDFRSNTTAFANINSHLFSWVLENLIRNSLDAMEGSGKILAIITADDKNISIELSDTGKGIPSSKHKTVFQPGYSTKTRGWGLGLSLAKRIIEEYHKGKIYIKESRPGQGTTFCIELPKALD